MMCFLQPRDYKECLDSTLGLLNFCLDFREISSKETVKAEIQV